jgi:hypothetical protein
MQQEYYSQINKNVPCIDRYSKPKAGSTMARRSFEDDEAAGLDPNLIRHLNGFVRSVQNQEDKED